MKFTLASLASVAAAFLLPTSVLHADNALATSTSLEGPSVGSDSVVLSASSAWSATANDPWLHTSASGTSNATVPFTFDANTGATRIGTLTIAGQTLTVTQAGSTYVTVSQSGTVVPPGLTLRGVATDSVGNLYFLGGSQIMKWSPATQTQTTLVSTGLTNPLGIAVDISGNVYIADGSSNTIKRWTASNNTLSVFASTGTSFPVAVAADGAGGVYFLGNHDATIQKWSNATHNWTILVTGVASTGFTVDSVGNVYFQDDNSRTFHKWTAATRSVSTLIASNSLTTNTTGVAVDGAGNLFILAGDQTLVEWTAATQTLTTLDSTSLLFPTGVTLDGAGNLYIANASDFTIRKWNIAAQSMSTVLSTGFHEPLSVDIPSFLLTVGVPIGGGTPPININGVMVAADSAGNLYVSDSEESGEIKKWTAATQTLTVLLSRGNTGPTPLAVDVAGNLYFTADNAVKEWTAATQAVSVLFPVGTNAPSGLAVDTAGNVYVADPGANTVSVWNAATQTTSVLVSTGLNQPNGLALDGLGNVYISDSGNFVIKKWDHSTQVVSTLFTTGADTPKGVALDAGGNLYLPVTGGTDSGIKKWTAATQTLSTLVFTNPTYGASGLVVSPMAVAVSANGAIYYTMFAQQRSSLGDGAGPVYISIGTSLNRVTAPQVFVDPTAKTEPYSSGSDSLSAVLPTTEGFVATSDQPWLTIGPVSNGVVNFSFTANLASASRQAHISLLGQTITVTQNGYPIVVKEGGSTLLTGTSVVNFGPYYLGTGSLPGLNTPGIVLGETSLASLGSIPESFTIQNTSSSPVTFGTPTIDGPNAGDFSFVAFPLMAGSVSNVVVPNLVTTNPIFPNPLGPSATTNLYVYFSAKSSGLRTATLHIPVTAPQPFTFDVNLQGIGSLAETALATNASGSWATLNGLVDTNGQPTTAYFQFGSSIGYGSSTATLNMGSSGTGAPFSFNVNGLKPGQTYHYRLVVNSGGTLSYGADQTFTVAAASPPNWHSAQITALNDPSLANMADGARTGVAHSSWNLYFYKGTDNNIWAVFLANNQWQQQQLTTTGNVSDWLAFEPSYGALCYQGTDGNLWCVYYNAPTNAWATMQLGTPPQGVTVAGDIVVDSNGGWNNVYYRGSDSHLYAAYYNGSAWNHVSLGGAANVQGNLAVQGNNHTVYYQGADNNLWCFYYTGKAWVQLQLTTFSNISYAVAVDSAGLLVYYQTGDTSIWCAYSNGGPWTNTQLYRPLSVPFHINTSTSFSSIVPYTGKYDMLYLDINGQCNSLYNANNQWTQVLLGDGGSGLTGGLSIQPVNRWVFARRGDGNVILFYYQ